MSAKLPGGSARSRARSYGRLVRHDEREGTRREMRQRADGTLTLLTITADAFTYTPPLRASEAAIAMLGWGRPQRFAIRHTFPNGAQLGDGYVHAGDHYPQPVAPYERADADAMVERMRRANPGHAFEVVPYPAGGDQ